MGYYRYIDGVRYDRALLALAEAMVQGKGDGRISEADMQRLYQAALDGRRLTETELRTFVYIRHQFQVTDAAADWLDEQLYGKDPFQRKVGKLIARELELPGLRWAIDPQEVARQEALDNRQSFEQALRAGVEAFLYEAESSTSLRDIIFLEMGLELEEEEDLDQVVRAWINGGKLHLIPLNYPSKITGGAFHFTLPDDPWPITDFWLFGLEVPAQTDYLFIAQVRRREFEQAFSYGYLPETFTVEEWTERIVEGEFGLDGLGEHIFAEEVERQLLLPGNYLFPAALREALRAFTRDEKDPESVVQLILTVFPELHRDNFGWIGDYHAALDEKLRQFFADGQLYHIPLGLDDLEKGKRENFYPPENGESIEEHWAFQLSLPTLSDHLFWAIVPRAGDRPAYCYGFN